MVSVCHKTLSELIEEYTIIIFFPFTNTKFGGHAQTDASQTISTQEKQICFLQGLSRGVFQGSGIPMSTPAH